MPTYEYECKACGATFERFQSITDKPIRRCPTCRGQRVRRLIGTGAGILFRGSGFYQTDYRSEEYKAKAKAETTPSTTASTSEAPAKTSPKKGSAGKHGAKASE